MDRTVASICLYLLLLFLFACNPTATNTQLEVRVLDGEGVCKLVNCVQGTCVLSNSFPGFDCQCYHGWKKFLPFLACSVPNCSVEFSCGNGAPPPPPPSSLPPLFNLSDPCALVYCGDGNCIANGTSGHICQCNDGATNIFGNLSLPCILQCSLGGDCDDLGLGPPSPPPPPSTSDSPENGRPPPPSPTPSGTSVSVGPVMEGVSGSLRIHYTIAVALTGAVVLNWV